MGRWNMVDGNEIPYDSLVVYLRLFNDVVKYLVFNVAIFLTLDLIFHDADGSNATLLKT